MHDLTHIEKRPPIESTFSFWGERTYVHGSHMVNGFLTALNRWNIGKIENFSFTIHKTLRTQGRFRLFLNAKHIIPDLPSVYAIFELQTRQGRYQAVLQGHPRPIVERIPDDEKLLIPEVTLDVLSKSGAVFSFPNTRIFSVITALNKSLHQAVFPYPKSGKWLLCRMDISCPNPLPCKSLTIQIIRTMGERMTRSIIIGDAGKFGEIYFSRLIV